MQELRGASEGYVRFYAVYQNGAADSLIEHRRMLQLCSDRDLAGVRHEVGHRVLRGLETLQVDSELGPAEAPPHS